MSASIRYFLTTKTFCQHCDGLGVKDHGRTFAVCGVCGGKGFILGEQEVEEPAAPNERGYYSRVDDQT